MLVKVEVTNSQGTLLTLLLENPSNGYIVEDIDGLTPVKATLVSSSFAGLAGEQYQSSRRETRNIKIKLELEPDFVIASVRELRENLYDFFMPETEVNLRFFMFDGLIVDILGRVETFDAPLFTENPTAEISLMCFKPDFLGLTTVTLTGMTTATTDETLVGYEGTLAGGIIFVLEVDRTLSQFTIYHRPPDGSLRTLDFAASLVAGDVLTISTVPGNKGATLTRAGSDSSLLYGVSPQSKWIELVKGANNIRVYATGAGIPYSITYLPRYGGL